MDYQGMLEDLSHMRKRLAVDAFPIGDDSMPDPYQMYWEVIEFISYIKELLASEEAYQMSVNV
jgi:hypothetical protein